MRIDSIIEFINDLLRKEQKGYRSPDQIVRAINRTQWRLFNTYRPIYAINIEAKEALAPFVKKLQFATDANGAYSIAANNNFQGLLGVGIQYVDGGKMGYKEVEFPEEDSINSRLDSELLKPTTVDPIGEVTGFGSFQLYPAAVYAGTIRHLRRPQDVVYSITQDNADPRKFTYNDGTSKQLEWAEQYQDKIIIGSLTLLGLSLSDEAAMQVGESLSKLR